MQPFPLDHLSDTAFEQFCFDLLGELGFVNVNWRKGTGQIASPSDRGRDIVCELLVEDKIDGSKHLERWFVECKHYKAGVPPDKIQGALAWANAERPDKLLIIVSNFLSNPTKDYIETYIRNNHPAFKVKMWENPDLHKLSGGKTSLLRKYSISGDFPWLGIMHPAHLMYIYSLDLTGLDYLFMLTDKMDDQIRDRLFALTYNWLSDGTTKIRLTDIRAEEQSYSYEKFKERCYKMAGKKGASDLHITYIVLHFTLSLAFMLGDFTSAAEGENTADHSSTKSMYADYVYFCENVVEKMSAEKYLVEWLEFHIDPKQRQR